MYAYRTGSDPIEIGDLGSKVKVTVTLNPFFLHVNFPTCISALLCPIKMEFGMSLRYALEDFCLNFKIEYLMTSLWRHLSFLQTVVNITNSILHTNFILGTNIQQHDVHRMIKVKLILTDDKGHRWRPKVTKMELMVLTYKLIHAQTSYLVPRYNTISDI